MTNDRISVEDFRGDAAAAAAFVSACWSAQFSDQSTCPQWDSDNFAWQMFSQPDNILLGAYAQNQLVGFVFGEPIAMIWRQRRIRAMFSTALAVDPAHKGQGIAKGLAAELSRRLQAQDLAFVYGFAVPGTDSLGPKFWQRSQGAPRARGIRPWIRPLSSAALADVAGPLKERLSARASGALRLDRVPENRSGAIRPFRADDLAACLDLVATAEADADLRYDWSPDRLKLQLDHNGIPSTLVYDDGTLRGFVNFHRVWFRGRQVFSAGMIDHVISAPGQNRVKSALLRAALRDIKSQGHVLAICPSSACAGRGTLIRQGFLPTPTRYDCLFPFIRDGYDTTELKRLKVHLR